MGALRAKHPKFDRLRLVKSDTDGFDPVLVVAAAETWSDVAPVLFFEFDPTLARRAGNSDPNTMWDKLGRLGYSRLAVWTTARTRWGKWTSPMRNGRRPRWSRVRVTSVTTSGTWAPVRPTMRWP